MDALVKTWLSNMNPYVSKIISIWIHFFESLIFGFVICWILWIIEPILISEAVMFFGIISIGYFICKILYRMMLPL